MNGLMPFTSPALTPVKSEKFNLKSAFIQTFNENLFFHVWRVAFDPGSSLQRRPQALLA